uniref:non-specific serine/threonine protein kinase n=1 Tax=Chromera velia CCMP2878 TaxID=1169474 RepID=A0A0G4GNM8_9ALVE|eukprot:Cvel_4985.t1-p1 / transcript=Cvel_4985.t1 / gene=Cvel_4985 / organism=Chromera_velia_CCMP2878 / gene_product=Serine/threonine-protein kinase Nek1, putative / transcript_product=Serine/threonine-protein kinase Nek1, putative / location=Cvel_scaffold225:86725-92203(+) / protein_length=1362 / sequence_SO=supercontig / SO=protein_coding / is_pseudo=false
MAQEHIVVIDDNAFQRAALKDVLTLSGYTVSVFEDGQKALEFLTEAGEDDVDLILCDIVMPVMDGLEFLLHVQDDPRTASIPVVMMSANDELGVISTCIERGAEDYLLKPITLQYVREFKQYFGKSKKKEKDKDKGDDAELYERKSLLGKGAAGAVYLVERVRDKKLFACKEVGTGNLSEMEKQLAANESSVLKLLRGPTIIKYYDSWATPSSICLVMEYAQGGCLQDRIRKTFDAGKRFSLEQIWTWLGQAALGLLCLHSRNILHRDLKTGNLFLTEEGVLKIGDFGVAKSLASGAQMASTNVGTPLFMSPEVCCNKPYNQKSDIWGLGMILYEIVTGQPPFNVKTFEALIFTVCTRDPPPFPEDCNFDADLWMLCLWLLQKNPAHRPTSWDLVAWGPLKGVLDRFVEQHCNTDTQVKGLIASAQTSHISHEGAPPSWLTDPSEAAARGSLTGAMADVPHIVLPPHTQTPPQVPETSGSVLLSDTGEAGDGKSKFLVPVRNGASASATLSSVPRAESEEEEEEQEGGRRRSWTVDTLDQGEIGGDPASVRAMPPSETAEESPPPRIASGRGGSSDMSSAAAERKGSAGTSEGVPAVFSPDLYPPGPMCKSSHPSPGASSLPGGTSRESLCASVFVSPSLRSVEGDRDRERERVIAGPLGPPTPPLPSFSASPAAAAGGQRGEGAFREPDRALFMPMPRSDDEKEEPLLLCREVPNIPSSTADASPTYEHSSPPPQAASSSSSSFLTSSEDYVRTHLQKAVAARERLDPDSSEAIAHALRAFILRTQRQSKRKGSGERGRNRRRASLSIESSMDSREASRGRRGGGQTLFSDSSWGGLEELEDEQSSCLSQFLPFTSLSSLNKPLKANRHALPSQVVLEAVSKMFPQCDRRVSRGLCQALVDTGLLICCAEEGGEDESDRELEKAQVTSRFRAGGPGRGPGQKVLFAEDASDQPLNWVPADWSIDELGFQEATQNPVVLSLRLLAELNALIGLAAESAAVEGEATKTLKQRRLRGGGGKYRAFRASGTPRGSLFFEMGDPSAAAQRLCSSSVRLRSTRLFQADVWDVHASRLRASENYRRFTAETRLLRGVELQDLSAHERRAFFLNVGQMVVRHSYLAHGRWSPFSTVQNLFGTVRPELWFQEGLGVKYAIGGATPFSGNPQAEGGSRGSISALSSLSPFVSVSSPPFSPPSQSHSASSSSSSASMGWSPSPLFFSFSDIKHGVFRRNKRHPFFVWPQWSPNDARNFCSDSTTAKIDGRVLLLLSDPPFLNFIQGFDLSTVETGLDSYAAAVLEGKCQLGLGSLTVPASLQVYESDFDSAPGGLLQFVKKNWELEDPDAQAHLQQLLSRSRGPQAPHIIFK